MLARPTEDPYAKVADQAGLRWVNDDGPGIRRLKSGKNFTFVDPGGKAVRKADEVRRIRSLAIPPAWKDVWISPLANGHIQATGRDVKGRKQYRYHARWRQVRDEAKYHEVIDFGKALPGIRKRTRADLNRRGLPREKVLAAVVQLLEKSLIRVGNEEYARTNKSFGLTTLLDKHVSVKGRSSRFAFKGKSGVHHDIDVLDKKLAKVIKGCRDLPGQELLQYVDDDGTVRDVGSEDVNEYLQEISGRDFTAKDFRTWAGTLLASRALQEVAKFGTAAAAKRNVRRAIESVAKRLGNTPTVCRKCYVHPAVIDAYMDGSMARTVRIKARKLLQNPTALSSEEMAVLALLEKRLAHPNRAPRNAKRARRNT